MQPSHPRPPRPCRVPSTLTSAHGDMAPWRESLAERLPVERAGPAPLPGLFREDLGLKGLMEADVAEWVQV